MYQEVSASTLQVNTLRMLSIAKDVAKYIQDMIVPIYEHVVMIDYILSIAHLIQILLISELP